MDTYLINQKHSRRGPIVVEVTMTFVPMKPEEIPAWNESARMLIEIGKKAQAERINSAKETAILRGAEGLHPISHKYTGQSLPDAIDVMPATN